MMGAVWVGSFVQAEEQVVGGSNSPGIIGKSVKSFDGGNLGTIKDLVIRWEGDGYIEYAVLSVGGGSFSGEEYIAVPWETWRFRV